MQPKPTFTSSWQERKKSGAVWTIVSLAAICHGFVTVRSTAQCHHEQMIIRSYRALNHLGRRSERGFKGSPGPSDVSPIAGFGF